MFKGFKEKLSNEYEKAKANIQTQALNLVNNGSIGPLTNSTGDNKHLNDGVARMRRTDSATSQELQPESSRTDTPKYQSEPGFSLVDLDDESDRSGVPPSSHAQQSTSRLSSNSDADSFFRTKFLSNMVSNFMPQSDIESEYESESSSRNLDNVSKEQLLELCYRLKDRSKKYRERWNEVVKAYRQTIEERDKLKNVLSETQDKAIRRISELKEQCNLEQEAKRHLEENLQVTIEEREEQIKVLQTKIELANNSQSKSGELIEFNSSEKEELVTKAERLESLLVKSNESLKSSKEKLSVLTKENESLLEYRDKAIKLETEIEQVRKLKDSASASFAEAKQKLHDELESRKIIIKELKDQNEKKSAELKQKNAELKLKNESIKGLNEKIAKIEKAYENEKSTLMEELSRGKTSALNILREEYEQKIKSSSDTLEAKIKSLSEENENLKSMLEKNQATASDSLRNEIVEMEQQLEKLRDELHAMAEERNTERELFEQNRTESDAARHHLQTRIDRELSEMNQTLRLKDQQIEEYTSQLASLRVETQKVKESEELVEQLKSQLSQLEKKLGAERDRYAQELESRQLCTTADAEEMEKKLNSLHEECRVKSDRVTELEKSLLVRDSHFNELSKEKCDFELQLSKVVEELGISHESNKQLKLELEKSAKKMEVTKKLIDKLREDNVALQKTVDSLQETNDQLMEGKKRQENELSSLNQEVICFKNKLIDIFYSEYADGDVQDIASLNYAEFLDKVQVCYQKRVNEDSQLHERVNQLEELVAELRGETEQTIAKERQHFETLKLANQELTREVERLRSVELNYGDVKDNLEQRTAQLAEFEEQVQNLTATLIKNQELLKDSNKNLKAKNIELEEVNQLLNQMKENFTEKERQISEMQNLQQQKDAMNGQYEQLQAELSQLCNQKDQLQEELKLSSHKCDDLSKQLAESNRKNSSYSEKISKIKSNTKEILESKHKLESLLHDKESEINLVRQKHKDSAEQTSQLQHLIEELQVKLTSQEDEKSRVNADIERLQQMVQSKQKQESEALIKVKELESQIELLHSEKQSKGSEVQNVLEELRKREEICAELEEKLKLRDTCEQELRTEIIALEEKLKHNIRGEKELKEDMKINKEVNESLKEQVHRYLADINELKNEMEAMRAKHEETVAKLYNQLEVRESQLDESLMNANSQYNLTVQDLLKSKTEISRLTNEVEELSAAKRELESRFSSEQMNVEEQLRKANQQHQCQIELLHSKLEEQRQEIAEKMDQFDNQESQRIAEHKKLIEQLEGEIGEKNVALEEVHEYYQQRLKLKDNELKHLHEQLTSTDRNNYQINALQNSILQYHEENSRLKELINIRHEKSNSEQTSHSRLNSDMENCALLGVHLPQPTEYEYLRNILFEFMMGREPVTLAKVIAAVMRFSNDQTDQIIRKQESIHVKHGKQSQ